MHPSIVTKLVLIVFVCKRDCGACYRKQIIFSVGKDNDVCVLSNIGLNVLMDGVAIG